MVPVVGGYKVQAGISRTATGGMEMAGHMRQALLGRNYSLTSALDGYMVKHAVENLCYVQSQNQLEVDRSKKEGVQRVEKSLDIDCGEVGSITLGSERFEIAEGIFKPEVWGLDQAGVHVLVKKAITECSLDVRKEVTQSIFLSGGLTLMPGFQSRLETELEKILPIRPKVHASPHRYHAAYLGACSHSQSPAYQKTRITRSDWVSGSVRNMASVWTL